MATTSPWLILMMSIYWVEAYILQRKITYALVVASWENELEVRTWSCLKMRMQDKVKV